MKLIVGIFILSMITNKCLSRTKDPFRSIANISHDRFGNSDICNSWHFTCIVLDTWHVWQCLMRVSKSILMSGHQTFSRIKAFFLVVTWCWWWIMCRSQDQSVVGMNNRFLYGSKLSLMVKPYRSLKKGSMSFCFVNDLSQCC